MLTKSRILSQNAQHIFGASQAATELREVRIHTLGRFTLKRWPQSDASFFGRKEHLVIIFPHRLSPPPSACCAQMFLSPGKFLANFKPPPHRAEFNFPEISFHPLRYVGFGRYERARRPDQSQACHSFSRLCVIASAKHES